PFGCIIGSRVGNFRVLGGHRSQTGGRFSAIGTAALARRGAGGRPLYGVGTQLEGVVCSVLDLRDAAKLAFADIDDDRVRVVVDLPDRVNAQDLVPGQRPDTGLHDQRAGLTADLVGPDRADDAKPLAVAAAHARAGTDLMGCYHLAPLFTWETASSMRRRAG